MKHSSRRPWVQVDIRSPLPWSPIRPAVTFALIARVVFQSFRGLSASWNMGSPIPGTCVLPTILRFLIRIPGSMGLLYPFFLVDLLETTYLHMESKVVKPSGHRFLTKTEKKCPHTCTQKLRTRDENNAQSSRCNSQFMSWTWFKSIEANGGMVHKGTKRPSTSSEAMRIMNISSSRGIIHRDQKRQRFTERKCCC